MKALAKASTRKLRARKIVFSAADKLLARRDIGSAIQAPNLGGRGFFGLRRKLKNAATRKPVVRAPSKGPSEGLVRAPSKGATLAASATTFKDFCGRR